MSDPMADTLFSNEKGTGAGNALTILNALFNQSSPPVMAHATEKILERLVILEMYMEEELKLDISGDELGDFRESHFPRIQGEVGKLANIFYGSVASREGG